MSFNATLASTPSSTLPLGAAIRRAPRIQRQDLLRKALPRITRHVHRACDAGVPIVILTLALAEAAAMAGLGF